MPAEGKIRLIRQDGSVLEATPEQAGRLRLLGYEPETPEQDIAQARVSAREDYYTSAGQKLETAIEGLGAGATFGATDYLFGDDETKARAAYNPGTRLGTELLGAIAPMLLSGGAGGGELAADAGRAVEEAGAISKASKLAPTNLLSEAAKALAPGKSLTSSVVRGAIEGGVYGGAGAADHAYLDGDPVTAEAVLHGIGWGAFAGGALSALGHGVEALGEKAKASVEADRLAAEAAKKPPVVEGALESTAGPAYKRLNSEVESLTKSFSDKVKATDAVIDSAVSDLTAAAEGSAIRREAAATSRSLYDKVVEAVNKNDFEAAAEAGKAYTAHVADLAKNLGVEMPPVSGAVNELIGTKAVLNELKRMPDTVQGFASMSANKVERIMGAFDKAKKLGDASLSQAITDAASEFGSAMGVEIKDAAGFRSAWKAAKNMYKAEGRLPKPPPAPKYEEPSIAQKAAGYLFGGKAWVAAHSAGFGPAGSYAAYRTVRDAFTRGGQELAATRAGFLTRIKQAAANYAPKAGASTKAVAPIGALAITLYGTHDDSTKDRKQLAINRIKEINQMAPTVKDTLFRAMEPLAVSQPKLTPALHSAGVQAFQALQNMVPKNPGVISALKPIWKPSDVQAAILEKQLAVFHDPAGAAEYMLRTGRFDPIQVQSLKEIAPNTWQELRVSLLERITDPKVRDKLSYHDQIGLSTMLDISIHSSMEPGYIATSQQIFMDRNKPLAANPRMGQAGQGSMPNPGDNVGATASQRSTER